MSDDTLRAWRFYLDDMIRFGEKVADYARGFDKVGFLGSGANYDAALRNLELIGDAATHVPDSIRAVHPQIPWRLLIATRNRLIHLSWSRRRRPVVYHSGRRSCAPRRAAGSEDEVAMAAGGRLSAPTR